MALQTVWSVDLGKSSLKAVKLRRDRNNIEILAVDKVDYPTSANGVNIDEQIRDAIGVFKARNNVSEPIVVSHPGQGTFYRSIKVPASDDKKVDAMVGYEAAQQIPFPLDEVVWDYHVLEKEYLPGEEREVALFAVRREAMDDFLVDFENEDMAVEVVSIGYLGLLNFVLHDIAPEEPSIILDIGAAHTDLVFVDGKRFWVRPLPHSGGDITSAISSRFKLPYPEAEKLKIESTKVPKNAVKLFQAVIQPKLKELVGEIHRSIGYYRQQAGEVNFKHLYLLGNGAKIVGIKKFLEEQLRVQVHRVQSINRFRVNREVDLKMLQANLPSFPTALGSGLQAFEAASCAVDLVPQEEKARKEASRKQKHAFIAAGILLVLMLVANVILSSKLGDSDETLEDLAAADKKYSEWGDQIAALDIAALDIGAESGGDDDDDDSAAVQVSEREILVGLGETRELMLNGFVAFDRVVSKFANAVANDVTEDEADSTASEAAVASYLEESLAGKLWVPHMKVTSERYVTDPAVTKPDDTNSVPAAKFEAYVVIKYRGDENSSVKVIRELFVEALANENKLIGSLAGPPTPEPGEVIDKISFVKGTGKSADIKQDGGPFFGQLVSWYITERPIPEPPEPEDEGDDDDDDDDDE